MTKEKDKWEIVETGYRNCEIQHNEKKELYWVRTNGTARPQYSMGMFTDFFKALDIPLMKTNIEHINFFIKSNAKI